MPSPNEIDTKDLSADRLNQLADFILDLKYEALPRATIELAKRHLLDLVGVAAAGSQTKLASIIVDHASNHFGSSNASVPILFSDKSASVPGAALAGGMMIDSIDAHDGHKPTKGHVGCGLLPALLAFTAQEELLDGREFLARLVIGYEIGSRAGEALHASAPDFHTSGAWIAIAAAATGSRSLALNRQQFAHALGIAEYHGPRSQMMRVIDHPTMLKDGSGFGAMAGCSAALLAKEGFTGAPAISVFADEVWPLFEDLGKRWRIAEQYVKPHPVCRWAQPAVEAVLGLARENTLISTDIQSVEVITFHEAKRLATSAPRNTEEAQYSLPFPLAAALVHGKLSPAEIDGDALRDHETLRIAHSVTIAEADRYNEVFPMKRIAEVALTLSDGTRLQSQPTQARGDPEQVLSNEEVMEKFMAYATLALNDQTAKVIANHIHLLEEPDEFSALLQTVFRQPRK